MLASPMAANAGIDPVTFQVICSRLSGIVQEMQDNIFRTGYSTIVRESQGRELHARSTRDGDVVGEHVDATRCTSRASRRSCARSGAASATTSRPATRSSPTTRTTAACRTRWTWPSSPRSSPTAGSSRSAGASRTRAISAASFRGPATAARARSSKKAIQYPPVRLVRAARSSPTSRRIVRANSRTPDLVHGRHPRPDRRRRGSANAGSREMIARYGSERVLAVFAKRTTSPRRGSAPCCARWPDGVLEAEGVRRQRRRSPRPRDSLSTCASKSAATASSSTSPRPTIKPPVRSTSARRSRALRRVRADRDARSDDPQQRRRSARVARDALPRRLGASKPTSRRRAISTWRRAIAVTEAIARRAQRLRPDGAGSPRTAASARIRSPGSDATGRAFVQYEPIASAYGASARSDGASGCDVLLSNCSIAPIEILESEYPTRMRRFELIRDSGGPGRFRGGCSPRARLRNPHRRRAVGAARRRHTSSARAAPTAEGRAGCGAPSSIPARRTSARCRAASAASRCAPATSLRLEKAGGGGLGDPRARPFERVRRRRARRLRQPRGRDRRLRRRSGRLDAALASWDSHAEPSAVPSSNGTMAAR